jgi:ech hydrogenase subunit F
MTTFLKAIGNLFRSPATVKYPFEKTYKPNDFRGLIVHNPEPCIWCRKCEMVCPPGAIVFSQALDGKQTYHYNRHVCIYCGECVRNCPKAGALIQSAEPAKPATAKENVNNGWDVTVKDALASRAAYLEAKKREREAAAAAAAAASKPEGGN